MTKWGPNISSTIRIESPVGISIDKDNLIYIVDTSDRVWKFASNGDFIEFVHINKPLNTPLGISLDRVGNIYVSDTNHDIAKKFRHDGTFLTDLSLQKRDNDISGITLDSLEEYIYVK